MCMGRRRLHGCFPPRHWEHPVLAGLSPKPRSQIRQKWFLKPPGEPFEELAEYLQVPADTSSPRSFFSPTGSTVYTRNKTARPHVGWPAASPVPQLSSSLREREYNHHPRRPQHTSQVCWWPEITVFLRRLQTCLRNVQRDRSDVSLAHPSLIHKTDSPRAVPILCPSAGSRQSRSGSRLPSEGMQGPQLPPAPQLQRHGSRTSPRHCSPIHSLAATKGRHRPSHPRCSSVPMHFHSDPIPHPLA